MAGLNRQAGYATDSHHFFVAQFLYGSISQSCIKIHLTSVKFTQGVQNNIPISCNSEHAQFDE